MILTIGQHVEALTNSDGRFRTLGRVFPVKDAAGNPVFTMPGHGLVDFEVMVGEVRLTLRCPLKSDADTAGKLRALREKDKSFGSRYFRKWDLLEKELVLFDGAGNPVEVDILARPVPQGEKAAAFLQRMAAESVQDKAPRPEGEEYTDPRGRVLEALRSFGEMSEWARNRGCERISARRVFVTAGGKVFVTGFSANDSSPMTALAFFFTAAMPSRFADAGLKLISASSAARPLAERLCAAASELGFPEPAQILAGDVAGGVRKLVERAPDEIYALGRELSAALGEPAEKRRDESVYPWREDDGEGIRVIRDGAGWRYVDRRSYPVIDTVWVSASPFREGRAEVEAVSGKGLIDKEGRAVLDPVYEELAWDDYFGLTAVMKEGRWSLLDRDGILLTTQTYDWLGECSEGLILAQKDGRCGFIDAEGREVIPCIYDDATSFSEGCALVTAGEDNFFINSKGGKLHSFPVMVAD